jgi:hypothetical protein
VEFGLRRDRVIYGYRVFGKALSAARLTKDNASAVQATQSSTASPLYRSGSVSSATRPRKVAKEYGQPRRNIASGWRVSPGAPICTK